MSWLSRVRNGIQFADQAAERRQSVAQVRQVRHRWSSPRNGKTISSSARAATITTASAPRRASTRCSTAASMSCSPAPKCARTRSSSATPSATPTASRRRAPTTDERDALINATGKIERQHGGRRGAGFRLHGRIDGGRGRRGLRRRRPGRDRRQMPLHPVHRGRRRADAGRHLVADADAAHDRRAGASCAKPACPTSSC